MIYGIETIGCGARRRYCIKRVRPGRGTDPVDGRSYATPEAARAAAAALGLTISREGDFYSLIAEEAAA